MLAAYMYLNGDTTPYSEVRGFITPRKGDSMRLISDNKGFIAITRLTGRLVQSGPLPI